MTNHFILVINPGSTSTKLAIYHNDKEAASESASHSVEMLKSFAHIADQLDFRMKALDDFVASSGIDPAQIDAVVGRGGLLRPIPGGVYAVNDAMLSDLKTGIYGEHASNLGGLLAHAWASARNIPAFIVDPVVVDEMEEVARITGIPEIRRRSIFHALNQKAVARAVAAKLGESYLALNLIVVHLGGGISIGAHRKGRVIDVNNALDGDGPFTPERAGSVPAGQLVELCFSNEFDLNQMKKKLTGQGGLAAHLGSNDLRDIDARIDSGDAKAVQVFDAMVYAIAKWIGEMAVALKGEVDAIVLTGGMAKDSLLVQKLSSYISWIAQIEIVPGENEMHALALGCLRILMNEETALQYPP